MALKHVSKYIYFLARFMCDINQVSKGIQRRSAESIDSTPRPPVPRCAWRGLTCPRQLPRPRVLQAWLKSSSSHRGKEEPGPPMQSRLSRLRLLESSLRDGRQLEGRKDRQTTGGERQREACEVEQDRHVTRCMLHVSVEQKWKQKAKTRKEKRYKDLSMK